MLQRLKPILQNYPIFPKYNSQVHVVRRIKSHLKVVGVDFHHLRISVAHVAQLFFKRGHAFSKHKKGVPDFFSSHPLEDLKKTQNPAHRVRRADQIRSEIDSNQASNKRIPIPIFLRGYTSLIEAYGEENDILSSMMVLDEMKERSYHPTIIHFNALIKNCATLGMCRTAELCLALMKSAGFQPNIVSISSLIKAYGRYGNVEKCIGLLSEAEKHNLKPNIITYNSVLSSMIQGKMYETGLFFLHDLQSHGLVRLTVESYALGFGACRGLKNLEKGLELLQNMKDNMIEPDVRVYETLLWIGAHTQSWGDVERLYNEFVETGERASPKMHRIYAAFLGLNSRWDPAVRIFAKSAENKTETSKGRITVEKKKCDRNPSLDECSYGFCVFSILKDLTKYEVELSLESKALITALLFCAEYRQWSYVQEILDLFGVGDISQYRGAYREALERSEIIKPTRVF